MRLLVSLLVWVLRALFMSRRSLALENLALRQQLAAYARTQKRPPLKPVDRAFWAALSKVWRDWRSSLVLVKPATVIAWHRRGQQRYWTWRCGKPRQTATAMGTATRAVGSSAVRFRRRLDTSVGRAHKKNVEPTMPRPTALPTSMAAPAPVPAG